MTVTLKSNFEKEDGNRGALMERLRQCAIYTIPHVLPRFDERVDDDQTQTYQSLGSHGTELLTGNLVTTIFPPGVVWGYESIPRSIRDSGELDEQTLLDYEALLDSRGATIIEHLEAINYRSKMRTSIEHDLVVGNSLLSLDGNHKEGYSLKNYRLDHWIVKRDGSGKVIYAIVREAIDPLNLKDEQLQASQLDPVKLRGQSPDERIQNLYTRVSWQPRENHWLIEQEINGLIFAVSEERVSPFIISQYIPVPGSDYGRGHAERSKGDLRALNALVKANLQIASALAMLTLVVDPSSGHTPTRIKEARDGDVLVGPVENGIARGIGFIQSQKHQDSAMVQALSQSVENRLSKSYLIESALQPIGERVTAFQVGRIARELEIGLGGIYSNIADQKQKPLWQRMAFLLERDGVIPMLDTDAVSTQMITGLAALSRDGELQRILSALQTLSLLGDELTKRLNVEGLIQKVFSNLNVDPRTLIKTQEQIQEEQDAQIQQTAADQTIQSIGNVAEQLAAQAQL